MVTKGLNSIEGLKGFPDTFSIYAHAKSYRKTIQTLQNPSESTNSKDLQPEESKNNYSELFRRIA